MSSREVLSSTENPRRFFGVRGGHMIRSTSVTTLIAVALASAVSILPAQLPAFAQRVGAAGPASAQGSVGPGSPADVIISNGKIITVDERFTIAQAVAVRGDRIVAVGSDAEIAKLAGPATRRIDLRGRSVIPGLIDNHMHLLRAGTTWQWEVRWDGVGTRAAALEKLRARVKAVAPGEWVYNLGGWAIEQFADDPRPFKREEQDNALP